MAVVNKLDPKNDADGTPLGDTAMRSHLTGPGREVGDPGVE